MSNIKNSGDQRCLYCKRSKKSQKVGNDIRKAIRKIYYGDPLAERLIINIELRQVYNKPQNFALYNYNIYK